SNNNEEVVELILNCITPNDIIHFCIHKLNMEEKQITIQGATYRLSLNSQEQVQALQEAIKNMPDFSQILALKEEARRREEEEKAKREAQQEEDKKNAFNQYSNNEYWYKEGDIGLIGTQLLKGFKNEVGFIGVCNKSSRGIKEQIENALKDSKRVIGIFNT